MRRANTNGNSVETIVFIGTTKIATGALPREGGIAGNAVLKIATGALPREGGRAGNAVIEIATGALPRDTDRAGNAVPI